MIDLGVDLDGIDSPGTKVNQGIISWLIDGAQAGQNVAMEHVPEDRSNLRLSMGEFVPEVQDGDVVWGVGNQPHALPQEFGTDPYLAPFDPLLEWAERQGADEPWGLAAYVWRKIAREGLDEQPYLRPGSEAQADWYDRNDVEPYIKEELE